MSRITAILALFALAAGAFAADVRMKSVARAEPGLPVRLGDVATITGKDADRLAALVVIDDPGAELGSRRWLTVSPDDIKAAMRANSIAPTRHTINGRVCHVRVRTAPAQRPGKEPDDERAPETVDISGPETVRTRIARTLAHRYGVTNDSLRVLFDPGNEALLSREITGMTAVVRPVSTNLSDRLRLEVRLVRGERVVASTSVTGIAQVRRPVAILTTRLDRGDVLTSEDLREDVRWLDPGVAGECAGLESAIGQRATNRLDPNAILRTRDVEAPLAVKRGDAVTVLTVAGGVSIETRARVLRDAVEGERVACRLHSKAEPFEGVVTGPGRVLVNLDAPATGTPDAKTTSEGDRR